MTNIQVACIGAAHRDIKSQALQEVVYRSSNPVRSESMWGGVARNICENLARLGISTTMVSRVGKDGLGIALRSSLDELGIGTKCLTMSATSFTASYTALLGLDGDMVIALADMEIYQEFTPNFLEPYMQELKKIPYWVVDLNLPIETLRYLADNASRESRILTMPVSVAKLDRIDPILPVTHTLVLNRLELSRLTKIDLESGFERAVKAVFETGVKTLIVTNGPGDVVLADRDGKITFFPVPKTCVADTTGGGDALAAGYFYGLIQGATSVESIGYGIRAAGITVGTRLSVSSDINEQKIREMSPV